MQTDRQTDATTRLNHVAVRRLDCGALKSKKKKKKKKKRGETGHGQVRLTDNVEGQKGRRILGRGRRVMEARRQAGRRERGVGEY